MTDVAYTIVVNKLKEEDGAGYVAYVPDLRGCISDGETPEEAVANASDAINEWIETAKELGRDIPEPGSAARRAMAEREALKQQLQDQRAAFQHLDDQINVLRSQVETVTERIEARGAAWNADHPILAGFAQDSCSEDKLH